MKNAQRFGTLLDYLQPRGGFSLFGTPPYVLTKNSIRRMKCIDCAVNVVEAGDWYMCEHELWFGELALDIKDNLCFDCLEDRLERPLRPFKDGHLAPRSVKGIKLSDRWHELFCPPQSHAARAAA
jgi:hypothetical protein